MVVLLGPTICMPEKDRMLVVPSCTCKQIGPLCNCRTGFGDSGNRMAIQFLPILALLVFKAWAEARTERFTTSGTEQNA